MAEQFDVIVVGNGSAGDYIARSLGRKGKKVAAIEREKLGGECLNDGCVPSKALIDIANRNAAAPLPWSEVKARVEEVQALVRGDDPGGGFEQDGVQLVWGDATFDSPTRVRVGSRDLEAEDVVLATGTEPALPPIPGLAESLPRTNRDVFKMEEFPSRLGVIGGGPIGLELGQAFSRCGSAVTIFESAERLAATEDPEVSEELAQLLGSERIRIEVGSSLTRVERDGPGVRVDSERGPFQFDELLVAAGRAPVIPETLLALGLTTTDGGYAAIDGCGRTNLPGLWAAGDLTGKFLFTHYATYQAHHIARHVEQDSCESIPDAVVPWAIFTSPEVGHVGMTEAQARAIHGEDVQTATLRAAELDWFRAIGRVEGFAKVVSQRSTGRLLGAHFLCDRASTIAGEASLAIQHGMTARDVASTIHPYPTAGELFRWCCARLA